MIYETQLRSNFADIQKCDQELSSISEICIPDVEPLAKLLSIKQADLSWLYDWEDFDGEFGLGKTSIEFIRILLTKIYFEINHLTFIY